MSPTPEPPNNKKNSLISFGYTINFAASSDDDEEVDDSEVGEYQLLPQEPPSQEGVLNEYNSVSSLMSALNSYGPNEISVSEDIEEEEYLSSSGTSGWTSLQSHAIAMSDHTRSISSLPEHLKLETGETERQERADLWNTHSGSNIPIDSEKEEQIKALMAQVKLPPSAVPSWATHISDRELQQHLADKIPSFKHSK